METIEINAYIHAPVQRVWELFSNHEGYTAFEGVKEAELLKPGLEERNGKGATRRIKVKGITFIEDIVGFDPPRRLEYVVRKCSMPVKHELGRIDLIPRGEGTEILWRTRFRVPVPILGPLLGRISRLVFKDHLYKALLKEKARLEADNPCVQNTTG